MHEIEEIYEAHAQTVYKYLLSLTRDEDLAEELTSETFYQGMKSIRRYNGECKVVVWLCQIAKHLWYRELEKRNKYKSMSLEDAEELESSRAGPLDLYLDAEAKTTLYRQLHLLDETTREVMYMRLLGDLSYREIGEILGRSEPWARVTFYRGKEKMKKGCDENEINP